MKTVHQMSLGECRLECERQAEWKNLYKRSFGEVMSKLAEPYDDVVELELRVKHLLKEYWGTDAADNV